VGSEAANLESQIESSGDTALVHLMADLKLNKKQLAKYRELTKEEKTSRGIDEKALEDEVSRQERELSKQSKAFADFNRRFNLKDVSSVLKGDEVFVDIARVPYFSTYTNQWTDSVKYLVFIHDAKDSLVDYRFIDNGKELEGDVFSDYKIDCSNQANATDLKNSSYYNSFWKPIADKIGSSKTVYVSLGGVYNNINLNTLYNPETGKYLVEEKDIRIVNNARDFILSKEQTARTYTSTSTALYGFPDYNGNETITKDTTDYLALTRDLDPLWIDSLTRGGLKAAPLPATKVEVEQIAKSFKENGWQVSEYLGDKASESNIKQEASPRVLHIATHGYFFDDIPTDKNNNERFLGMERQRVVQDPMLRSGLLLTGANKALQGEKVEGENGLLSASEASLLNLRGTELVVLSACETGKGEVKNSEGVYGLRKAFSDAGAANTIMSLWKVDDKVTQEFMTRFYEIWLNEKTSIREAFNRAQLEIKTKYPQPYYWGAFVLVER
jgi:CHAT domain-containing protein